MNPVARITLVLAVFLLVLPIAGRSEQGRHPSQQRALQLPATGQWYEGLGFDQAGTSLGRGGPLGNGYTTIYLANLEPGLDYTLGLRYPADTRNKIAVELFDRWPYDPKARRFKLAMGPVVRTDPDQIEYRWRLGVSGRSQGNIAFVVVQAGSRGVGSANRFRHFMYLTTPAIRPMNQVGTGITYLRGPSDLLLHRTTGPVEYVIEYPYERTGSRHYRQDEWRADGDLIFNGDFRQGLQGWDVFSEQGDAAAVDHVATGREGLRIWGNGQALRSGVRQMIQRDVQGVDSLVLEMDLRIIKDSRVISGDAAAAAELIVCYLDAEGKNHCGDKAYRVRFTTHRLARRGDGTVRVKAGEWFPFQDELMNLDPRPRVIKSVAITGGQSPGQSAWISQIHLTERGGIK